MKTHLTMQELEDLGFELQRSYPHDEWHTQVRKKGVMTIETTYKLSGEFVCQEVKIESDLKKIGWLNIYYLDELLNKHVK
jgi:hypothetical protein